MFSIYSVEAQRRVNPLMWLYIKWQYHYLRDVKRYEWRVLQGPAVIASPKMNRENALVWAAKHGAVIGYDEVLKAIFLRPKI